MLDEKVRCPRCGTIMDRHAEKIANSSDDATTDRTDPEQERILVAIYTCPRCGHTLSRALA